MGHKADCIFINGVVITVDPLSRVCQAVAVRGNRILAVGANDQIKALANQGTAVIDLKGRSLLPGFVEAHCHPGLYAASKLQVRCTADKVRSIEQIKEAIAEKAAATPPGAWIVATGYNETELEEKRHPNRWDLDQAAPQHKVLLVRACYHIAAVNSLVLQDFGIDRDTADPEGGEILRDAAGEPTGVLFEQAKNPMRVASEPNHDDLLRGLRMLGSDYLSLGFTSLQDASGVKADEIQAYQDLIAEGWPGPRICFAVRYCPPDINLADDFLASGLRTGFGNQWLKLGPFKIVLDGSGSGATAAMREPYPDSPAHFGITYFSQHELNQVVCRAHRHGYQIAIHAIGDQAVEMAINAYAAALRDFPRQNHRHRIEHCGFVDEAMLAEIRDLGVVPVMGTSFMYAFGDNYMEVFDQKRLAHVYPMASLAKHGVLAALSSDAPVMDPNPMYGIYAAISRRSKAGNLVGSSEAIGLMDAIRAYTYAGAYASFDEDLKGSIEVGKLADLVVLSENVLETATERIPEIKADLTMVDGKVVFER